MEIGLPRHGTPIRGAGRLESVKQVEVAKRPGLRYPGGQRMPRMSGVEFRAAALEFQSEAKSRTAHTRDADHWTPANSAPSTP